MAQEKILEVENLTISFSTDNGLVRAVRGVSFDLSAGETLCIVGESGSGKSVTSKAIMGILASNAIVDDGTIMYRGENLLEISEEEFHKIRGNRIGMIFQDPLSSLNPIVRIGKQITEAMLINSNKLKQMYEQLIEKELIAYKNCIARRDIRVKKENDSYNSEARRINALIKGPNKYEREANTIQEQVQRIIDQANSKIEDVVNIYKAKLVDIELEIKAIKENIINEVNFNLERIKDLKIERKNHINNVDQDSANRCSEEINKLVSTNKVLMKSIKPKTKEAEKNAKPKIAEINKAMDIEIVAIKKSIEPELAPLYKEINDLIQKGKESKAEIQEENAQLKKLLADRNVQRKANIAKIIEDANSKLPELKANLAKAKVEAKAKVKQYEEECKKEHEANMAVLMAKLESVKSNSENSYNIILTENQEKLAKFQLQIKNAKPEFLAKLEEFKKNKQVIYNEKLFTSTYDLEKEYDIVIAELNDNYEKLRIELEKNAADARSPLTAVENEIEAENERYISKLKLTKKEAKKRALKVMEEVGIPLPEKRFRQYPFEFSGGMRQRIVIAIALTAAPEILICDEPTTALDVTIQAQILELIKKIQKERNIACIFITHDLGVVANMADRVAVMYAGKIVEYGNSDEIFFDPKHPYTWALLSSIPDVDSKERLEAIPGTPPNMIYPPKGDAFALRSKYAMKIDFEHEPPFFKVSDTHYAATWLLHEDAPKVEMPKIVSERIRIALENQKKEESSDEQ